MLEAGICSGNANWLNYQPERDRIEKGDKLPKHLTCFEAKNKWSGDSLLLGNSAPPGWLTGSHVLSRSVSPQQAQARPRGCWGRPEGHTPSPRCY